MKLALKQIWDKYNKPTFSYLIVKNVKDGSFQHIEGYRYPDNDGGCMGNGTSGALYGYDPDTNEHWYHYPKKYSWDNQEWKFIKGYEERFFVFRRKDSKIFRGIEETKIGYWILDENNNKVHYHKEFLDKITEKELLIMADQNRK